MILDCQLFLEGRMDKLRLINSVEFNGWNALHLTCFLGNQKLYLWLLSEGADLNIVSKDAWTCLQIAIWQQHYTSTPSP